MKLIRVTWHERHSADVWAQDEDEAEVMAIELDKDDTHQSVIGKMDTQVLQEEPEEEERDGMSEAKDNVMFKEGF